MTDGDYVFVSRAGAELPVWVNGNVESGVFIVTLHGGPGNTGYGFALSPGFVELEERYGVVYWDQRASGNAQGNPSADTFTVADFVADTDAVISLVRERYAPEAIFVFGHSWGGDLALATMVHGQQAEHVTGWMVQGGAHDEAMAIAESREWMVETIDGYIADGVDPAFWREVRGWYDENPTLLPSDPRHYSYVSRTTGYFYEPENYQAPPITELAFNSPMSLGYYENDMRSHRLSTALLDGFDVSDGLPDVTAPALILGGEMDGVVRPSVIEEQFALLGTPDEHKELVVYEQVAHSCHDENPDLFSSTVVDFVERYRP